MEKPVKAVACLCIFSTLFVGCYSSAVIVPRGNERARIYSGTIQSVITKDGIRYVFHTAPAIVNDTIVGVIEVGQDPATMTQDVKQVRIPISDVESASISEIDTGRTIVGLLVGLGSVALIFAVVEESERPRRGWVW
jgi:hypothetical protein